MSSRLKWVLIAAVVLGLLFVLGRVFKNDLLEYLILSNPPTREMMYPPAPAMPPVVSATMDELLKKLDQHMMTKAPALLNAMQPGLTDEQLAQIERDHKIEIPPDIKSLYKWRNGCAYPKPGARAPMTFGPMPGKHFLPLDEALRLNAMLRDDQKKANATVQRAYAAYAGHRESWIFIFSDGAGDGYYFDPKRKEAEGAVFFNFAESLDYVFFPSIRNLFAAIEKCYATGAFHPSKDNPADLEEDFEQSQAVWLEFGAAPKIADPGN